MPPPRRAAVALLSGGLDSGTAAALWRADGGELALCLTADYGQRAAGAEQRAAARLAQRWGAPWQPLELGWLAAAARRAGSALVDGGRRLPERSAAAPGDAGSAAAVWVPARNLVLLSAAAAFAEALAAGAVLAGFNREEAATFADNSQPFVESVNAALAYGARARVEVVSPTLAMSKPEIAMAARRCGLGPADFWSCYDAGPEPCGRCESCARAAAAWSAAG
jgi:7-cyano-7-deazaguanine synthase